jgi:RNA polymerase sigma-70 factor (ECF subfamily)
VTSAGDQRLDGLDDRQLLSRHVAGDADAFSELVRRHRDRLWAVAMRTIGDRDEAADALQDALLSAFRRAESYRGEAAVTTWLHRVVVNACLDRVRRRNARPADALPDDADSSPALAAEPRPDPALASEERIDVMAALRTLTPEQRAAIVLVDMEGYSVYEAAAVLDCAPGTVKSRCARGRARLVPLLAHLRVRGVPMATGSGGNQTGSASVASSGARSDAPSVPRVERGGEADG